MNEDFNIVVKKIKAFKKKYFLFKFLQGLLVVAVIFIVLYFLLILSESIFYFSGFIRKTLFHSSVLFLVIITLIYVFYPLLKYADIVKTNNKRGILRLIENYYPEVKDKLVNILELNEMKDDGYSLSVIHAAVIQKSRELRIFEFTEAITLKNLKNLVIYFVISFLVTLLVYSFDRSFITEPLNRIIHFNQVYKKPAPYDFVLLNEDLKVRKGGSYTLRVKCEGREVPGLLFVNIEGNNFLMKREDNSVFEYDLPAVTNPLMFAFTDLKYSSDSYLLNIVNIPVINNYQTEVIPPAYTMLKNERNKNVGDLKVPKGSFVKWNFDCFDTDSLVISLKSGRKITANRESGKIMTASNIFRETETYEILVKGKETDYESIMKFSIEIIDDLYPEIDVDQKQDSTVLTRFYFSGKIKDDYGFSQLKFHISNEKNDTVLDIMVNKSLNQQIFYYSVDLLDFKTESNSINYFFSVSDNDMVNQFKTTVSESFNFKFPTNEELELRKDADFKNLEKLIQESREITQKMKSDIKELQLKSISNNMTAWEKNQMINDILSKKNNLENLLDKIEQVNQLSNSYQSTFDEQSQEIAEKQKQMEELLEDVMTEELKKLLDEFNRLADEFNEKKFNELNPKLDLSLEDLTQQLDRNLEMLKRMKIEQNMESLIKKIERIEENEEINAKDILNTKDFNEGLKNVEEDFKGMEEVKQGINDILKENEELKKPMIFDSFEKEQSEIFKEMTHTKDALTKRNRKESSGSMQRTVKMLENLSFAMRQMMKANQSENKGENILTLKRILKNLLYISVNQEDVLNSMSGLNDMDPSLRNLKKRQKVFTEQLVVIKDSLYALANRAPQIGNMVNEELVALNINLNESVRKMDEGNIPLASVNQRMVITASNNLILFLSDLVKRMEEQDENGNASDEACDNGNNPKKMGGLKKGAGSIKDQLQQMIDKMKKGEGKNMSREMSEALMQHELMQKMLRDLMNSGGLGNDAKKQLQQIDQLLEQNRKEIMNKMINPQMITRHNQIMSKLLEAENSENERDLDNKRESNTADVQFYSNPAKFFEGIKNTNSTFEELQKNPVKLTQFYREKQRKYLEKSIRNGSE